MLYVEERSFSCFSFSCLCLDFLLGLSLDSLGFSAVVCSGIESGFSCFSWVEGAFCTLALGLLVAGLLGLLVAGLFGVFPSPGLLVLPGLRADPELLADPGLLDSSSGSVSLFKLFSFLDDLSSSFSPSKLYTVFSLDLLECLSRPINFSNSFSLSGLFNRSHNFGSSFWGKSVWTSSLGTEVRVPKSLLDFRLPGDFLFVLFLPVLTVDFCFALSS